MDKDGKLSEAVKGFIVERSGKVIGMVLFDFDRLIIEFLAKDSPMIIYDKTTGKTDVYHEPYVADPKRVLKKLVKVNLSIKGNDKCGDPECLECYPEDKKK